MHLDQMVYCTDRASAMLFFSALASEQIYLQSVPERELLTSCIYQVLSIINLILFTSPSLVSQALSFTTDRTDLQVRVDLHLLVLQQQFYQLLVQ